MGAWYAIGILGLLHQYIEGQPAERGIYNILRFSA
jgi:hypothetical protein